MPVGLKGDVVVACDLTQVPLQLFEELLIALGLIQGHKRVHVGKLLPGDGLRRERENREERDESDEKEWVRRGRPKTLLPTKYMAMDILYYIKCK